VRQEQLLLAAAEEALALDDEVEDIDLDDLDRHGLRDVGEDLEPREQLRVVPGRDVVGDVVVALRDVDVAVVVVFLGVVVAAAVP